MAVFEKVERGTASQRELAEYRQFMAEFRDWRTMRSVSPARNAYQEFEIRPLAPIRSFVAKPPANHQG